MPVHGRVDPACSDYFVHAVTGTKTHDNLRGRRNTRLSFHRRPLFGATVPSSATAERMPHRQAATKRNLLRALPTDHRSIQNHIPAIFHRLHSEAPSLSVSLGDGGIFAAFSTTLCHRSVFILQRVRQVSVASENCRRRNINRRPGRTVHAVRLPLAVLPRSPRGREIECGWAVARVRRVASTDFDLPLLPLVTRNNSPTLNGV